MDRGLKNSEQLLKYSQSLSNMGSWEWNISTGENQWSDELFRIHGLPITSEVPDTESYFHLVHPDDRDRLMQSMSDCVGEDGVYDVEYRIITKNELKLKFIKSFGRIITNNLNQKKFIGYSQDITEIVVEKRAKLENENLLDTVFNTIPLIIMVVDKDLNVIKTNRDDVLIPFTQNAESVYLKPGDILNCIQTTESDKGCTRGENCGSCNIRNTLMQTASLGIENKNIEAEINVERDGERHKRFITLSTRYLEKGGDKILVTVDDVSNQKNAENEITELANRLSLALDTAEIGIWDYDINNDILVWDERMYELYGISEESLDNKYSCWEKMVDPDDLNIYNQKMDLAINEEQKFETVFRMFRPDGSMIHVRSLATLIRDKNGRAYRILGVNYDVSKQINIQEDLTKAKEKAEESDRLKSAFIANMSHEIRTPMNGILGFADLISSDSLSREDLKKFTGIIKNSSLNLLNIVNDILDISTIETGQMKIFYEEVNIRSLIQEIYEFHLPNIQAKGLQLQMEIKHDLPETLISDKMNMKQILNNLISNAAKFTNEGIITILCARQGANLSISINDTGIGIPESHKGEIFERFMQVHTGQNMMKGGTGLGLAISKNLSVLLGGDLELESQSEPGSTFTLTLPLSKTS